MLSGITLAAKALKPDIIVVAAEPSGTNGAADVAAAKQAGQLVRDLPKPLTIADGLQGRVLGFLQPVPFAGDWWQCRQQLPLTQ